jgi:transposase-like protein
VFDDSISSFALINAAIMGAKYRERNMTPEERAERNEKVRLENEARRNYYMVLKGDCPKCDGKLKRGKKDKRLDYKREWKCKSCETSFHM